MNDFIKAILFVVVAVFGIIASTLISNQFKKPVEISPTSIIKFVTCPKDFEGYKNIPQKQIVKLIDKRVPTFAADGKFINPTIVVTKKGGSGSEVACGYLHIKAGTNSNGLLQDWENVYINPYPYGGHITTDKSISVKEDDNLTEMLFSLNDISYRVNKESKEIKTANWTALMNVSNVIEFNISLNTENKTGFIDGISIAYRCFNPETGKETNDCKFEITERRGL